jgi:hypothetical protein
MGISPPKVAKPTYFHGFVTGAARFSLLFVKIGNLSDVLFYGGAPHRAPI